MEGTGRDEQDVIGRIMPYFVEIVVPSTRAAEIRCTLGGRHRRRGNRNDWRSCRFRRGRRCRSARRMRTASVLTSPRH